MKNVDILKKEKTKYKLIKRKMKKMTLFTLFLTATTLLSCSNQEQTSQDELTSINATASVEQNYDYLYGIEIYYRGAEAEVKRLQIDKMKLVTEMEKGDKGAMEKIENIQIEIERLNKFIGFLTILTPPKGPKQPPLPPQPCLEDSNCDPTKKLTANTLIILGKDLIVSNVFIKNMKNQLVEAKFQPVEDSFSQSALQLKSNFKGEGIMYTTLKTKAVGEITIPIPVVGS